MLEATDKVMAASRASAGLVTAPCALDEDFGQAPFSITTEACGILQAAELEFEDFMGAAIGGAVRVIGGPLLEASDSRSRRDRGKPHASAPDAGAEILQRKRLVGILGIDRRNDRIIPSPVRALTSAAGIAASGSSYFDAPLYRSKALCTSMRRLRPRLMDFSKPACICSYAVLMLHANAAQYILGLMY